MRFQLIKRHKRLWVVDTETGEDVYTPPDFLRVLGRGQFNTMLRMLNEGARRIDAVMAFESSCPLPKRKRF